MIDEFPILFVAAAFARGTTVMRGIGELRVKESDRITAMATGLAACGVRVEELPDGLIVHGSGGEPVEGGATVAALLDHRIAMSFAVLGLRATAAVTVDDARPIATSFPGFAALMERVGAIDATGGLSFDGGFRFRVARSTDRSVILRSEIAAL